MGMVECKCGTLYFIEKPIKRFGCKKCKRTIVVRPLGTKKPEETNQIHTPTRFFRWIFIFGSTVGLFLLSMMIPTMFYIEGYGAIVFLVFELVMGSLLVCASVSFYLLSLQVSNMQSLINFHQHNLHIFADQLSKLSNMIRRRGEP